MAQTFGIQYELCPVHSPPGSLIKLKHELWPQQAISSKIQPGTVYGNKQIIHLGKEIADYNSYAKGKNLTASQCFWNSDKTKTKNSRTVFWARTFSTFYIRDDRPGSKISIPIYSELYIKIVNVCCNIYRKNSDFHMTCKAVKLKIVRMDRCSCK